MIFGFLEGGLVVQFVKHTFIPLWTGLDLQANLQLASLVVRVNKMRFYLTDKSQGKLSNFQLISTLKFSTDVIRLPFCDPSKLYVLDKS